MGPQLYMRSVVDWNVVMRRVPVVSSLSPQKPGSNPSPVHVGFVVCKVAMGKVYEVLSFLGVGYYSTTGPCEFMHQCLKLKNKLATEECRSIKQFKNVSMCVCVCMLSDFSVVLLQPYCDVVTVRCVCK